MEDLEVFLEYIFSKKDDNRISINEYIIDENNKKFTIKITEKNSYKALSSFEIDFDITTKSITLILYPLEDIIIINEELCKKWHTIIDSYLKEKLDIRINNMINSCLSQEPLKDFHRSWKLKKIIKK